MYTRASFRIDPLVMRSAYRRQMGATVIDTDGHSADRFPYVGRLPCPQPDNGGLEKVPSDLARSLERAQLKRGEESCVNSKRCSVRRAASFRFGRISESMKLRGGCLCQVSVRRDHIKTPHLPAPLLQ